MPDFVRSLLMRFCALALAGLAATVASPAGRAQLAAGPEHRVIKAALLESEPVLFTAPDGTVQGIGADVLARVFEAPAWEVKYIPCDREHVMDMLQRHEVDLVFPMTRTPEREKNFDFSDAVLVSTWAEVFARRPDTYTSIMDLKGARVACVEGTFFTAEFLRLSKDFDLDVEIASYGDYESAYHAVGAGEAVAAVGPSTGYRAALLASGVYPTAIVFAPAPGRFVTAHGANADLLARIDDWFKAQGDAPDSEFNRLRSRWFGMAAGARFPTWLGPALIGLCVLAGVSLLFAGTLRRQVRLRTQELRDKNTALEEEVAQRIQAQQDLAKHQSQLEDIVLVRTAALEAAQGELIRKERLAVLGQLTATVSHELRNPMATIRGTVFVIEKQVCKTIPSLSQQFERVNRNIERCDRIVDELLDYARVRQLNREPTPLGPWIRGVIDEFSIPEGVRLDIHDDFQVSIELDTERMRRCIQNLVSNACQAMDNGNDGHEARLEIGISEVDAEVLVEILDNGPGIPSGQLERVFEPLYSTKNFGVGLGLSLSRQIAEAHGGTLTLHPRAQRGLAARIRIPIQRPMYPNR